MKKIVLLILLASPTLFSQNVDNSFNPNNSGPYNEFPGGYGTVMSDGNIITNNYTNLYNLNAVVINNSGNFIPGITYSAIVNGYNNKLVAFNRNDLGIKVFNYDGSEVTTFITPTFTGTLSPYLTSAKVDPDGKILVSGDFEQVNGIVRKNMVRLNPDGSVDTSFINLDDNFVFNGPIYSFARQTDGKYLVGGQLRGGYVGNYHNISLARINADGTLDNTFFDFTSTSYGYGLYADIERILLQPDGKIIIVGPSFKNGSAILSNIISRLNPDGSRDTSFNCLGLAGSGYDALLLPDGKYLVSYNGTNGLKKLNANGTLDTSFNYQNTIYFQENYLSLQLCPDNKILINCPYKSALGITREKMHKIDASGALDFTFNPQQSTNRPIQNMAVFQDGSIFAGSSDLTSYNDTPCKVLIKLTPEGVIDNTFNLDSQINVITNAIFDFKEFSDGKILIASGVNYTTGDTSGRIYVNTTEYKFLRLNENGSYDSTFHPVIPVDLRYSEILNNDKILYANYSDNKMYRLNYDGSNDATFTPYTFYAGRLIKKFNDGSVYFSGRPSISSTSRLWKLDSEGQISNTFNCYNYLGYSVVEFQKQDDKFIIAYNNGGTNSFIRRLNSDGTLDSVFTGFTTPCDKIIINSENKIFIISGSQLKGYNADGIFETTTDFGTYNTKIYQQSCDRLLVQSTLDLGLHNYNGNSDNLKRYSAYSGTSLVNPPTGQPIQNFTDGDTLQDLVVTGNNILWYSSQSDCGFNINNNKALNDTPLPSNTILVNNTTYYASQTINNVESTYRLPVTASASLNTVSHNISNFKIINPVKDALRIYGKVNIIKVQIYSLLGANLLNFNIDNESQIEIDLRGLIPNIYLVKLFSSEGVETKKIIKN